MPATARRRSSDTCNIKVAVRVRGGCEGAGPSNLRVDGNELLVQSGQPSAFAFDHCYGPEATQPEVYDDVGRKVLDAAFEGYNGTIFAYGQTGSGKTYSIMGTPLELGIVPRLAVELFQRMDDAPAGATFEVTATYAELYNEVISDLLTPGHSGLKIRQHVSSGIYVEDLTEVQVCEHEEIEKLIAEGNKARQVAATRMNERSSRSHAIFTIMLRQQLPEADGAIRHLSAKINLVDLAGSERADMGADAKQLQEGAAINKSLSALGNVINALTEGSGMTPSKGRSAGRPGKASGGKDGGGSSGAVGHVPYRSSKLTRLLEESLGGNTVTYMLATVSAEERNARETLATLKYAQRAKKITNTKSKNEAKEEKRKIRELTAEIERLNSMMASSQEQQQLQQQLGSGRAPMPTGSAALEQSAAMAEMRMELEKARHEASLAAAASLASAAKADELRAELEAAQCSVSDLDVRLRRASGELTTLQGAQRAAELDVQHARQELSQERLAHADEAHRIATLNEELGAMRRQLQNSVRQVSDAREEAAEAVAQRRTAERQLQAAESELIASRAGMDARLSQEEQQLRASTELLTGASRDRQAHAELLDKNLAAFEALLAQKDGQLAATNDKLADARDQLERRSHDVSELQVQLASRAAAYEELTERKAELLSDVRTAQADAQRWADEASRGNRRADGLDSELGNARREVQLLRKRLEVKEVHVGQLMKENATIAEQLRTTQEHLDTPESMVREMLRMTEVEIKLKSQLHAEKEGKLTERIKDLEKQLSKFGVDVHAPAAKPMSFANFFAGLKFGIPKSGEGAAGANEDDKELSTPEATESRPPSAQRRASFGRAAEARASFGRNNAATAPQPRSRGPRPPLPPSAAVGADTDGNVRSPDGENYRTPRVRRAERRMSFSGGLGSHRGTPASGVAGAVEDAVEAVAENAGRAADAAGRAVDGLLKSTNNLFGSVMSLVDSNGKKATERHGVGETRLFDRGHGPTTAARHHSAPPAQRRSSWRRTTQAEERQVEERSDASDASEHDQSDDVSGLSESGEEDEEMVASDGSYDGWSLQRRRHVKRASWSSEHPRRVEQQRLHATPPRAHQTHDPPLPPPPHPVRLPDEDEEVGAAAPAASWRSQLKRESFSKGSGEAASSSAVAPTPSPPARRRPLGRALVQTSPRSRDSASPSSASHSGGRLRPDWDEDCTDELADYVDYDHHAALVRKSASAKRQPRAHQKPNPGVSPTAQSYLVGHVKQAPRKKRRGSATPSPVPSPGGSATINMVRGKSARRVPSWPAGESASRRSKIAGPRLPRSVSFAKPTD